MGRRTDKNHHHHRPRSHTLPSSPTHSFSSSSSSDFEFTISLSPRKSSTTFYPADELFYKGQLLPLHLSPRISMVRTLLLASSSVSSSSETNTSASRDSTGSSNDSNSSIASDYVLLADCESSRPSSVTEDDEFSRNNINHIHSTNTMATTAGRKTKYLSKLSRFSSVFRKDSSKIQSGSTASAPLSVKRMSATAKEVICKYLKKVKPLYEKLSQKQQQQKMSKTRMNSANITFCRKTDYGSMKEDVIIDHHQNGKNDGNKRLSFSGNLRYPRKKSYVTSCPSSMRSSPNHSGILCRSGFITPQMTKTSSVHYNGDSSSMEELQNAIQGAIAHCKNSMTQNA